MLDLTRTTTWERGRNFRGEGVGAGWMYVLPQAPTGTIACLGAPSPRSLVALVRLAAHIDVYEPDAVRRAAIAGTAAAHPERITLHASPAAVRPAALVIRSRAVGDGSADLEWMRRACKPGGVLWFTHAGIPARAPSALEMGTHFTVLSPPVPDDPAWVVPAQWPALVDEARHRTTAAVPRMQGWRAWWRFPPRPAPVLPAETHAWLLNAPRVMAPPEWLQDLARTAGLDVRTWPWRLWARGEYASQKAIVELFDPAQPGRPAIVVKVPRAPEFSPRLENEARALRALAARGLSAWGPRLRFAGAAGPWYAVGEDFVAGAPFEQRSSGGAADPLFGAALASCAALGAQPTGVASSAEVATVLQELLANFVRLAQPATGTQEFLTRQLDALAAHDAPVPLVFMHGDAGTWNLTVAEDGTVQWLDWEAAEEYGLPLWDLWMLGRAYAVRVAPSAWPRRRVQRFEHHFMGGTALHGTLVRATRDYCARVGVAPPHVEPLFHACWMHRALKEATRLGENSSGPYRQTLEACIRGRAAAGLRALLDPGLADQAFAGREVRR